MRSSCAWVAGNATRVVIAGDPVAYGKELLVERESLGPIEWDEQTHYRGDEAETIAFVITLDAINFGSGYFPHLLKRPGYSGYFTVALSLKEHFEREGPLGAAELRRLEPKDVAKLLHQHSGDTLRDELMVHYARALNELGGFLERQFEGSFEALVAAAEQSAQKLVAILAQMTYFRDVASYRDREVPLLKRAQIAASDLALALPEHPLTRFVDLDRLTIFADNLVPHVLRLDGLLEYAKPLAQRLARGEPLPAGSAEEVEVRAVALHAVESMVEALRSEGVPTTAREFDLLLWNRGQAQRYRGGSKHRTRTIYY